MKSRHLDRYMPEVLTGSMRSVSEVAHPLDRRDAQRVPLQASVSYVTDAQMGLSRGQGRLIDLSKMGCKILGPVLMLGTAVTVVLDFHDEKDPLCISAATVTWSDGQSFGVRFPKLKAEDRQRLQELVLKFATFKGSSQHHAGFRLV